GPCAGQTAPVAVKETICGPVAVLCDGLGEPWPVPLPVPVPVPVPESPFWPVLSSGGVAPVSSPLAPRPALAGRLRCVLADPDPAGWEQATRAKAVAAVRSARTGVRRVMRTTVGRCRGGGHPRFVPSSPDQVIDQVPDTGLGCPCHV